MESTFPPALPHGPLQEVFDEVFFVTGTIKMKSQGTFQFSRNMTVIRESDALTLINTVRLNDEGLAALETLGNVRHIVKIGAFHGVDDAFYLDRYRPQLWGMDGMDLPPGVELDHRLEVGGRLPFADASLFVFSSAKKPEAAIVLDRSGGILITCDSLQNWADTDEYFDEPSAAAMRNFGFIKPANVGPGWLQMSEPKPEDFAALKQRQFRHLLSGHGSVLRDTAHEQLSDTFRKLFGV